MKNADLIRQLPTLSARKRELAERKRKAKLESAAMAKLEDLVDALSEVGEVVDGVAIKRMGEFIEAVSDDIRRCASTFLNQHNHRTWGLHTYDEMFGRKGEKFHGNGFTRAEANRLALDWVIRGKLPADRFSRRR